MPRSTRKPKSALGGARPDDGHIGDAAVGDPGLLAVEDPGIAVAARGGAHAGGIGSEIGLGQAEASDGLAALQGGEPLLLLLLAAVGEDGVHDERALHGDEAAHAGIDALEFLHDEAVLGIAHAGAAVAFEVGAEEAEVGHFRYDLGGKAPVAEAIADQRQNAFLGEPPRGLPHHQLLFTEEGVDAKIVYAPKCHFEIFPTYLNTVRAGCRGGDA